MTFWAQKMVKSQAKKIKKEKGVLWIGDNVSKGTEEWNYGVHRNFQWFYITRVQKWLGVEEVG